MSAKSVSITRNASSEVVQELERLLERARSGELVWLHVLYGTGSKVGGAQAGNVDRREIIWAFACAQHALVCQASHE